MIKTYMTYLIIAVLLLTAELIYFRTADKCNIINKPNERSSHSTIVLRGGGVIFAISIFVWMILQMVDGEWSMVQDYLPFMVGLLMVAGISFVDDIHSLSDSLRMLVQIASILLMFWNIGLFSVESLGFNVDSQLWSVLLFGLIVLVALFFCVGATNIINFMDGINGITAGYALAMLLPIALLNHNIGFIEESYLIVAIIGVLVFSILISDPRVRRNVSQVMLVR